MTKEDLAMQTTSPSADTSNNCHGVVEPATTSHTDPLDGLDIESGVSTAIPTDDWNESKDARPKCSREECDDTAASSAASTNAASTNAADPVILASNMNILEAKAVIAASRVDGTSALPRHEQPSRVFRFAGLPSMTKTVNGHCESVGARPTDGNRDVPSLAREGKVLSMCSNITSQPIVCVKVALAAARVEEQRRAAVLEREETFRRSKETLVDHATMQDDSSCSSYSSTFPAADLSEEQFAALATAKLVIAGADSMDEERARVMQQARLTFIAETAHAEPVEFVDVAEKQRKPRCRGSTICWYWAAFVATLTIVMVIVTIVLMAICDSSKSNGIRGNTHQTEPPVASTDAPSVAPLVYTPTGKRAFTQTSQLHTAVDDYLMAVATKEDMANSTVAAMYGYPIGTWDVSRITDFSRVFDPDRDQRLEANRKPSKTTPFNEDLSEWDVSSATTMSGMFAGANNFSGLGLDTWNVAKVTDFSYMFAYAGKFAANLSDWNMSNAVRLDGLFQHAKVFDSDLSRWNVSRVESASYLFAYASHFVGGLQGWDVSRVTNMASMFSHARKFTGGVSSWNTSRATTMSHMFSNADLFNDDLSSWSVGSVVHMSNMFNEAVNFVGGNLTGWDTSNVKTMDYMFNNALSFNGNISSWDVSQVVYLVMTFGSCPLFNSDLSRWNTSNVENARHMFYLARLFSSDISGWDTRKLKEAKLMFGEADSFNSDLSQWDVSSLMDAEEMFVSADRFNQSLCSWRTQLPKAAKVVDMFSSTNCTDTSDPSLDASSTTPFCGRCDL